jgi:hypothetical protein
MVVGIRNLIRFNDCLRYSLGPGFNPDKYPEREGGIEKLQRIKDHVRDGRTRV